MDPLVRPFDVVRFSRAFKESFGQQFTKVDFQKYQPVQVKANLMKASANTTIPFDLQLDSKLPNFQLLLGGTSVYCYH